MKINELLKKYGDLEISSEQEKQIKDYLGIKKNKKLVPKYNEIYFYVTDDNGTLVTTCYDNIYDINRFRINNYFKSNEEAEFRAKQIKVYNELKNFADENNDEINWDNLHHDKWVIYYIISQRTLLVCSIFANKNIGQIYFSSKELAEQAIKTVGEERIIKYLFGVE